MPKKSLFVFKSPIYTSAAVLSFFNCVPLKKLVILELKTRSFPFVPSEFINCIFFNKMNILFQKE